MLEIAEESAPETDSESPVKSTNVQGDTRKMLHDAHGGATLTIISNKKIARLSLENVEQPRSQRLSDEEIIRVSAVASSDPTACLRLTQLQTESVDKLNDSPRKVSNPGYCVKMHATSSDNLPSLCLQMMDRIDKTEESTVTAWRDSEYVILDPTNRQISHADSGLKIVGRSSQFAVIEVGQRSEHNTSTDLK